LSTPRHGAHADWRVLDDSDSGIEGTLRGVIRRLGEPVIRKAMSAAMREMGEQFVLGLHRRGDARRA